MNASTTPISAPIELHEAAAEAVDVLLGHGQRVTRVTSHLSAYSSSFRIEEVAVSLASGEVVHIVRKDLAWEHMLAGARRIRGRHDHDPRRELDVYRQLLPLAPAGPPRLLAGAADGVDGPWLMLERIAGDQLRHVGAQSAWETAAEWAGAFHAEFATTQRLGLAQALGLPRWSKKRLQLTFVTAAREIPRRASTRVAAAAIRAIKRAHPRAVQRLAAQAPTLIHGQLYPSNVIVPRAGGVGRAAVLDWETAAIGPGVIDLAALTEGSWTPEQRGALVSAYLRGRDGTVDASVARRTAIDLACARLHLCLEMLAMPLEFEPPDDHTADWLDIAVGIAGEVAL
jgi:hypothetical protein